MLASEIDSFVLEEVKKADKNGGAVRLNRSDVLKMFPMVKDDHSEERFICSTLEKMVRLHVSAFSCDTTRTGAVEMFATYILTYTDGICDKYNIIWDKEVMNKRLQERVDEIGRSKQTVITLH